MDYQLNYKDSGRFNIRMRKDILAELRVIANAQDRSLNDLFKEMGARIIRENRVEFMEALSKAKALPPKGERDEALDDFMAKLELSKQNDGSDGQLSI